MPGPLQRNLAGRPQHGAQDYGLSVWHGERRALAEVEVVRRQRRRAPVVGIPVLRIPELAPGQTEQ